jgi:hypothetical protein
VVEPTYIVHRLLIINLLPQSADEQAWWPDLATCLLLCKHCIQYWGQPVFEFAVVIVWHNEATNMIHVASPQVSTIKIEVSEIHASKALDEVLIDATGSGNDVRDMLVLHEVQNNFAKARDMRLEV